MMVAAADTARILDEVRARLHSEPRFDPRGHLDMAYDDGALTIEGEVRSVAVKKLLLERAAAHPDVTGIIDRLRVQPTAAMGDDEVRVAVRDALLQEPALAEVSLFEIDKGERRTVRALEAPLDGEITIAVAAGVVTLTGEVRSLAHKRLAGVLAWWVPGSRDVINGLGETAPEAEVDEEITDAVRLALEKDPFVNADQVRVTTGNAVVLLQGVVPTDSEREMAEADAWYVFGVDDVENRIEVQPVPPTGGQR